jgi:hypothetical protein
MGFSAGGVPFSVTVPEISPASALGIEDAKAAATMDNNKVLFIVRFRLKKSRGIINTRSFLPQAICETFHKRINAQWGKARSPVSPEVRRVPVLGHSDSSRSKAPTQNQLDYEVIRASRQAEADTYIELPIRRKIQISLTPRFSGVRERHDDQVNCFNSFLRNLERIAPAILKFSKTFSQFSPQRMSRGAAARTFSNRP